MTKAKARQRAKAKAVEKAKKRAVAADQPAETMRPGQFDAGPGSIKGAAGEYQDRRRGTARGGAVALAIFT